MEVAHGPPPSEGRFGVLPWVCEATQRMTLLVARALLLVQHDAVPSMQWESGRALRLILAAPRPTRVHEHASLAQTSVSSALLRPVCSVNRSDNLFKPKRLRG